MRRPQSPIVEQSKPHVKTKKSLYDKIDPTGHLTIAAIAIVVMPFYFTYKFLKKIF
jgi:hypothetical protein